MKGTVSIWKIATIILFMIVILLFLHIHTDNSGNFRVNERGETYNVGPIDLSNPDIVAPDLMAVVGVHGKKGYVKRSDYMETIHPSAIKNFNEYKEWLQEKPAQTEIAVYKNDGITQIDTYLIGSES